MDGEVSGWTVVKGVVGFVVAILALSWILQGNDFFLMKFFAPKVEAVRRETFEQSKSYNQGMRQDLSNFQAQFITADSAQKDALASVIRHRFADFPLDSIEAPELRDFLSKIRSRSY